MTPTKEAVKLLDKFFIAIMEETMDSDNIVIVNAKKCALITVNEILNSSPSLPILSKSGSYGADIEESTEWWQEVKQEIEKL